jgi:hypothetical protein
VARGGWHHGVMSTPVKACDYCNNLTFHYLPDMRLPLEYGTTVLGMSATKHTKGEFVAFALVVCTNCGQSRMFTTNAQALAQLVPGASVISGAAR